MKKSSQRSRNVSTAASIESGRNEAAEDGLHRRSRSMDAFPKVKALKVKAVWQRSLELRKPLQSISGIARKLLRGLLRSLLIYFKSSSIYVSPCAVTKKLTWFWNQTANLSFACPNPWFKLYLGKIWKIISYFWVTLTTYFVEEHQG